MKQVTCIYTSTNIVVDATRTSDVDVEIKEGDIVEINGIYYNVMLIRRFIRISEPNHLYLIIAVDRTDDVLSDEVLKHIKNL